MIVQEFFVQISDNLTIISNHLQMSLQMQHILLSYLMILSVGPVWGSNPRPPAR